MSSIQSTVSTSGSGMKRKRYYKYNVDDTVRMDVVNGLKPTEALRVRMDPCTHQSLNCLLSEIDHTKNDTSGETIIVPLM